MLYLNINFFLSDPLKKYHQQAASLRAKAKNEDVKAKQEVYNLKANGHWKLARATVGAGTTKPIEAAERVSTGPQGQLKGSIAIDPMEVDFIIRKVYGKIYKSNSDNHMTQLKKYKLHYGKDIFRSVFSPLIGPGLTRLGSHWSRGS